LTLTWFSYIIHLTNVNIKKSQNTTFWGDFILYILIVNYINVYNERR